MANQSISPKLQDLKDKRFYKLTVIERAANSLRGKVRWLCKCDCGKTKIILASSLIRDATKTCGCGQGDGARRRKKEKIIVKCHYCGKEKPIYPSHAIAYHKFFCYETNCYGKWLKENKIINGDNNPNWKGGTTQIKCDYCGKIINKNPTALRLYKNHFCNSNCHDKFRWSGGRRAADERRSKNWKYILRRRISASVRDSLLRHHPGKNGRKWEALVGYDIFQLIGRLKKTIPSGYTWKDFTSGKSDLTIDHIKPVSAFNFQSSNDLQFKECWALKNLRLLPARENYRKQAKLIEAFTPPLPLAVNQ